MAKAKEITKAFAYVRTSSATNVGADKDSDKRQLAAIESFAKRAGFTIVGVFKDDAVSGEDDIASRPGFSDMLDALEANGTRTVIVEDASRFARKLIVQELGILSLLSRQVTCWAAGGEVELTNTDDEFKIAMRQVAGAFAQLEKTRLVKKLKAARDRKRNPMDAHGKPKLNPAGKPIVNVKVEGRKSVAELRPGTVKLARDLSRARPKGGKRSLREISAELAAAGHLTGKGTPYTATAVAKMLESASA